MSRPQRYDDDTRAWALGEFKQSRSNYPSRSACVQAIAAAIGAHTNTVGNWVTEVFGPSSAPAEDDVLVQLAQARAEVARLRVENINLHDQLRLRPPERQAGRTA